MLPTLTFTIVFLKLALINPIHFYGRKKYSEMFITVSINTIKNFFKILI